MVIRENDKKRSQSANEGAANHTKDLEQVPLRKLDGKLADGVDVGHVSNSGILGATGRHQNESRTGLEPTNAEGGTRILRVIVLSELLQDLDPDLCLVGDLVSDADSDEGSRAMEAWVAEKTCKGVADCLRSLNRAEKNIENGWTGSSPFDRVDDGIHLKPEVELEVLDDLEQASAHLRLGCFLPLSPCETSGEPGQPGQRQPVLLRTIDDPVVELRVSRDLLIDQLTQPMMIVLEKSDAITVRAGGLGKDGVLQRGLLLETEDPLRVVEEVEQEVEAGDWIEARAVIEDVLVVETSEHRQVVRLIKRENSGKLDG